MSRIENALILSQSNYNCAQAVFVAYADQFGLDDEMAKRIAAGFGGGIGKSKNICGAISGAIMLLGLKYYNQPGTLAAKEKIYALSNEFITQFKTIFSSDNCKVLKDLNEKYNRECSVYIQRACELVEAYLE